jgi:hypothetical protein
MVAMADRRPPGGPGYPQLYERLVPIALGIILVAMIAVLLVVLAVASGLLPGITY